MAKSLTTLIADAQAMLLDDGTRFTTATVTAAIRNALKDFNRAAPIFAGELVDVVSGQKEYALNSSAFDNLIDIHSVLKQGTDANLENNIELTFDGYFEDAAPFIRLRSAQSSGYLIVRYTIPYTVSGLDSEVASTLPAYWDNTLLDGACYYSCLIRSVGRVETINLNQGVPNELQQALSFYRQAFQLGLAMASRRKPPVSEPNGFAWNDDFHNATWTRL
jgi:hypothetical protein